MLIATLFASLTPVRPFLLQAADAPVQTETPAKPQTIFDPTVEPSFVRVLLVTGESNHDWEWTSAELERILEASGIFQVDVTRTPGATLADAAALDPYAALVLDYNGARWGEAAETGFLAAVASGKGVAVLHAANNAFSGWVEYEKLVGLCWRDGTGHGEFHPFDVKILSHDHPLTRRLADLRLHPDELYHRLVPMHGVDNPTLATAFDATEIGGSGRDEPMIVARSYGKSRVFHTPLGHVWKGVEETRASYRDPQFQDLVVRGVEWAATGDVKPGSKVQNWLTPIEERAGWRLMFDGESTAGWRGYGRETFPSRGWSAEDGALTLKPGSGGGDLVFGTTLADFELEFEWKVEPTGNSGLKYRIPDKPFPGPAMGPEYQMLDDKVHPERSTPRTGSGALREVVGRPDRLTYPGGNWHRARIVARGPVLEHWLNGTRTVLITIDSPDWARLTKSSSFYTTPTFGRVRDGFVLLQDFGDGASFRSMKVRDWTTLPGTTLPLFEGTSLEGWEMIGDALWSVEDEAIVGASGGGSNSFLVTEEEYGDFLLEIDVQVEGTGNSGIQVRSHVDASGKLSGYQAEIDPSERRWSGGLQEEGGRGWLDDLEGDSVAQAALVAGEWNKYRIECVGPSIKVWVNGVPTADIVDSASARGVIGLQVHGGGDVHVRWKDFWLRSLDG